MQYFISYQSRRINKKKTAAILHDPRTSFSVLKKLAFENDCNNQTLMLYKKRMARASRLTVYETYRIKNISDKLFDLACNQLCFKKIRSESILDQHGNVYFNNLYSHQQQGVFVYYPSSINNKVDELDILLVKLMKELLQLPNQHHFLFCQNKYQYIWILNNNGSKYSNIDWENMDLNQLINNLPPELIKRMYIENCIEYCIKNNQFTFLKKVLYFAQKMHNQAMAIVWPKYREEHIMMQVKKYIKIVGNHPYFVIKIEQILAELCKSNDFINSNFMTSLFSNKVETFVKQIVIPTLKLNGCKTTKKQNIQFLKQKTSWQCFLCKNINDVTQNVCPHCYKNISYYKLSYGKSIHDHDEQLLSNPLIQCLNPYQAFIANNSRLFNIQKFFGVVSHGRVVIGGVQIKNFVWTFAPFNYQNKDKTIVGVTCDAPGYEKLTILFDEKNALTIRELKIILYELICMWRKDGRYSELLYSTFIQHPVFKTMSGDTIIPSQKDINGDVKYYSVNVFKEFYICKRIRNKYKIHFGKNHCNYQCPFMIKQKLIEKDDNKENNGIVSLVKYCPYANGSIILIIITVMRYWVI